MSEMKAVVVLEGQKSTIKTVSRPQYADDEVLVQVMAAAVNPTDWKHVKYISPPGSVVGCDFAGKVVAVGKNVTDYKVGDRLASMVHGGSTPNEGSFAEFTPVLPKSSFRIPDGMSYEAASTYGVSSGTAAIALFQHLGLRSPENPYIGDSRPKLLVWGASSVAGLFAVQLAHLAGVRVVATASAHSHELLKQLGAEETFDYRDPDVIKKIREWASEELVYGFDCISEKSTVPLSSNALTGGKLVLLLSDAVGMTENNPDVTLHPMLLYTSLGREFTKFGQTTPGIPKDLEWGQWWWKLCTKLTAQGLIKTPKYSVVGGLEAYEEAFSRLEKGLVRAEKLVLKIGATDEVEGAKKFNKTTTTTTTTSKSVDAVTGTTTTTTTTKTQVEYSLVQ